MNGTYNVKEAAELLHVRIETVRKYLRDGQIKGFKVKGSKKWLIPTAEIKKLMETDNVHVV